jgi:hypothetical protein
MHIICVRTIYFYLEKLCDEKETAETTWGWS